MGWLWRRSSCGIGGLALPIALRQPPARLADCCKIQTMNDMGLLCRVREAWGRRIPECLRGKCNQRVRHVVDTHDYRLHPSLKTELNLSRLGKRAGLRLARDEGRCGYSYCSACTSHWWHCVAKYQRCISLPTCAAHPSLYLAWYSTVQWWCDAVSHAAALSLSLPVRRPLAAAHSLEAGGMRIGARGGGLSRRLDSGVYWGKSVGSSRRQDGVRAYS